MHATSLLRLLAFAALCALAGAAAAAPMPGQLGRSDLVAPGYLISTCGGFADNTNPTPGDRLPYPGGSDCHSDLGSAPGGHVASSAFFSAAPVATAIASGSAGFGFIRARAGFTGPNSAEFPRGAATGGWMDHWLISAPGLAGKRGLLTFQLDVDGVLHAEPGGFAHFEVFAFRDGLPSFPPAVDSAKWGRTGPFDELVDEIVTMTIGFTFDKVFDLEIFARAQSGTASRSSVDVESSGYALFDDTLRWAGIAGVSFDGAAVDYTLASASGIDWRQPLAPPGVPEPAAGGLVLAGLALLALRRRQG